MAATGGSTECYLLYIVILHCAFKTRRQGTECPIYGSSLQLPYIPPPAASANLCYRTPAVVAASHSKIATDPRGGYAEICG